MVVRARQPRELRAVVAGVVLLSGSAAIHGRVQEIPGGIYGVRHAALPAEEFGLIRQHVVAVAVERAHEHAGQEGEQLEEGAGEGGFHLPSLFPIRRDRQANVDKLHHLISGESGALSIKRFSRVPARGKGTVRKAHRHQKSSGAAQKPLGPFVGEAFVRSTRPYNMVSSFW